METGTTPAIGNGLNIYYDPTIATNAYLRGGTYPLISGGVVAPILVPEPAGFGTLALLAATPMRRRRR